MEKINKKERNESSERALIEIIKNKVYDDWDYSQLLDLKEFIEHVMEDKKPDELSIEQQKLKAEIALYADSSNVEETTEFLKKAGLKLDEQ